MADIWNLACTQEAIADAFPDRECIIFGDKRFTWTQYRGRARRLANYLRSKGLGNVQDRSALEPWESGQDQLALYLYNGNEYLEGMFGAFRARLAPFNVNYRYTGEELEYLLKDSRAKAIIYHASLAPTLAEVRPNLPELDVLLQVADDSGEALLEGAVDYEKALAGSTEEAPDTEPGPDDLYILYTGGTTGMPKGVLWRQEDIYFGAMGGTLPTGQKIESYEQMIRTARAMGAMMRAMPLAPFMHGAAHWYAHMAFHMGGTVIIPAHPRILDPDEVWSTIEEHKATSTLIVGDAFAVPLLEQLGKKDYNLKSLRALASGGAILSPHYKEEFLEKIPGVMITDGLGSSESGAQAALVTAKGGSTKPKFQLQKGSLVLSEDLTRVLEPGTDESGWLAREGHIPLGYLGDPEKTKKTFIELGGKRYSIPGDHARPEKDGTITLFGRGSVCIATGGEKVYPEEVEKVLKLHDAVYDAVVVGTPNPKWGQQVTAVCARNSSREANADELRSLCKEHLAGYKAPKDVVWVDELVRSPSGKADYRWAAQTAKKALGLDD